MAFTTTFAIDNLGPYNVVANTYCSRIVVQENFDSANPPTADLKQYIPAGGVAVRIPKGTPAVFTFAATASTLYPYPTFTPGQVVGQINTSAGSITVQQIESSQV